MRRNDRLSAQGWREWSIASDADRQHKNKKCPQLIFWGRRFFVVRVDVSQHFIEGAVIEISQLTKGVRSLSAPLSHQLRNVRHSTKFQARHDVETDRMEGSEKPRWQNRN